MPKICIFSPPFVMPAPRAGYPCLNGKTKRVTQQPRSPSPRQRGEGAGRRMRGERQRSQHRTRHPTLALRQAQDEGLRCGVITKRARTLQAAIRPPCPFPHPDFVEGRGKGHAHHLRARSHPSCRKDAGIRALAVPAWPLGSKPEGDEWQEWWRQSRIPTSCIFSPPFVMPGPRAGYPCLNDKTKRAARKPPFPFHPTHCLSRAQAAASSPAPPHRHGQTAASSPRDRPCS